MPMIEIKTEPSRREVRIFAILWLVFISLFGWLLPAMGGGLLVLTGVTGACFLLSLAFNRDIPRRGQAIAVAVPLLLGAIWWLTARSDPTADTGRTLRRALLVVFLLAGIGGGAATLLSDRFGRTLYVLWMRAVAPIGWTISHALLSLVYFGVVTPIGLALRLSGRDLLNLSMDRDAETHWTKHPPPPDAERYVRQF